MEDHEGDGLWLFGYGSLIWKPPPHFDLRLPGYIDGYVRRFWQASEDHRGTPEAPGRVVTLIELDHWKTLKDPHQSSTTGRVWGAAYHIPESHVAEVRDYLDIREINGYSIQYAPFHRPKATTNGTSTNGTTNGSSNGTTNRVTNGTTNGVTNGIHEKPIICLVYIGLPSNPQFVGPQNPAELACHILRSRGPSGENREYLYMLDEALASLSAESGDEHISDLAARCRVLEKKGAEVPAPLGEEQEYVDQFTEPLHKSGSTEEQEEVEKPVLK